MVYAFGCLSVTQMSHINEFVAILLYSLSAVTSVILPVRIAKYLKFITIMKSEEAKHELCHGMLVSLTLWVRHLVGLMEDIVLRGATGRLARYLLDAPTDGAGQIELPTLRRHLASHLNLTSETFSRTIRRLTEAGLIHQDDAGQIRTLDREKLRLVAEGLFPKI